tara:strand:+ start:2875 stop:3531 length:657 start_codon:yes stop_codon:yes gene_type:complete
MDLEVFTFLTNVVITLEGIAALVSILYYKKVNNTPLKFFPLILIYIFVNEFSAEYTYRYFGTNVPQYNVYNIIFFLFFYYVFWSYVKNAKHKQWIKIGAIIFILSCFVNVLFQSFVREPQLLTYVLGACLLIFCIILYYIEILTTSKILLINQDFLFWISVGLLLFYVGYIPIKLTRHFFVTQQDLFPTLRLVHYILIIIMNGFFIFGFLWTTRRSRV